jgi:hypothetical protein
MRDAQDKELDSAALWRVEAVRYALLRRLAFAMRHHLVVNLQPIGMITEVMERRLKAAAPDLQQVRDSMDKIHGFSRAAVQSCMDVVSWLAPEPDATVMLDEGVGECLALLRSHFNFRGFRLCENLDFADVPVSRCALRSMLPAALLALTDRGVSPAEVLLTAAHSGSQAVLTLALRPVAAERGFAADEPYRMLEWDELQALAAAESVTLAHQGEAVRLTFPVKSAAPASTCA